MGQMLHGNFRTTEAACRAVQDSQKILRAPTARCGINPFAGRLKAIHGLMTPYEFIMNHHSFHMDLLHPNTIGVLEKERI